MKYRQYYIKYELYKNKHAESHPLLKKFIVGLCLIYVMCLLNFCSYSLINQVLISLLTHTFSYTHSPTHTHSNTHTHIHTRTHANCYTHIYITYVYINVYVYIFIYIHTHYTVAFVL